MAKKRSNKLDPLTKIAVGLIFGFVALVGIGVIYTMNDKAEYQELAAENTIHHRDGSIMSQIKVVEFADIQCPACAAYHDFMKAYVEHNKNRVNFEYKHFPLTSIHNLANDMAKYSVAIWIQNEDDFWKFLDIAYDTQQEWTNMSRESLVEFLELRIFPRLDNVDVQQVYEDFDSEVVEAKLAADMLKAREVSASGTPTFMVNGEVISTPRPLESEWDEILGF